MICRKLIVYLCVVCAVFAFDESGESTEIFEVNSTSPESANVTEASSTGYYEDTVTLLYSEESTNENETDVSINPSSAQLQTNATDDVQIIGITRCDDDSHCKKILNAYCKEGYCHCLLPFVPHPVYGNVCIEKAKKIGDKCEITKQCEDIADGICIEGVCALENIEPVRAPQNADINSASSLFSGSVFFLTAVGLVAY